MREKAKKIHKWFEKGMSLFNLAFFVVSIGIWLVLTIINISSQPFHWELLWAAFNQMYGEFSFKVSCILLIVFNGLQTIRNGIQGYNDMKENVQHASTVHKAVKGAIQRHP